jgi:hypothetical protein
VPVRVSSQETTDRSAASSARRSATRWSSRPNSAALADRSGAAADLAASLTARSAATFWPRVNHAAAPAMRTARSRWIGTVRYRSRGLLRPACLQARKQSTLVPDADTTMPDCPRYRSFTRRPGPSSRPQAPWRVPGRPVNCPSRWRSTLPLMPNDRRRARGDVAWRSQSVRELNTR